MKSKISVKLTLYFMIVILVLCGVMSLIFAVSFRQQTIGIFEQNLLLRAKNIADTYSSILTDPAAKGMGAYYRFLDDIAMADVWIVDESGEFIKYGSSTHSINLKELPPNADEMIQNVMQGQDITTETFSEIYNTPTITVGVPVTGTNGIAAAVLLSSPVSGTDTAVNQGVLILIFSIGIGVVLSALLGIFFSAFFTKPLKKMNRLALQIAEGDYAVKTSIKQRDELGELDQSLNILASHLDDAAQQSGRLEQMRKDFIANISHELRTPVTVIKGYAESLLDGVIDESEKETCYRQIVSESSSLERLIRDLLELSRLQNPDFQLSFEPIDMNQLLWDVLRGATALAGKKNIAVEHTFCEHEFRFSGDYGRLRQMLTIVLDNAIKFSEPDSVIRFQADCGQTFNISVKDHGKGISPEDLPQIFNRFYKSSDENINGTGLGLAIAKEIADRHAIKIEVDSRVGEGTEFVFRFEKSVG